MLSTYWHTQQISDILSKLNTNLDEGLTTDEVASRLKRYGSNNIANIHPPTYHQLFLRQFYSFTVAILALAIIGLLLLKRFEQSAIVLAVLFVNICLGYIQKFEVNKQLGLLKQQMTQQVKVLRNGQLAKVDASEIVPGDVIFLGVGDRVPVDARIVEAKSLLIDESSLFLESVTPIRKNNNIIQQKDLPLGEIKNMAYAGTLILDGSGTAIVTATGNNTELSRVLRLNHLPRKFKTDCQILKQMRKLRNYVILISIGIGIAIAITIWRSFTSAPLLSLLWGEAHFRLPPSDVLGHIFELGMSFIVASSPSGMVAIALSILAYNVYKIFQQGATVKELADFETLGKVTAFLADEASNFMNAEMVVKQIFVDGKIVQDCRLSIDDCQLEEQLPIIQNNQQSTINNQQSMDLPLLIAVADLSTDVGEDSDSLGVASQLVSQGSQRNDIATDVPLMEKSVNRAIVATAGKIRLDRTKYTSIFTKTSEIPYNSKRKRRNVILEGAKGFFMFTVGDAESILPHCRYIHLQGQLKRLDNKQSRAISMVNQHFSDNCARVLAVVYRQLDAPVDEVGILSKEREQVFLGLIALDAILVDDVKGSIKNCRNSGLKILMMTDSNKNDAFVTARRLGILEDRKWIISKKELESLSEDEYSEQVENILVYSELRPENKTRVINHLQKKGYIVAAMGNQGDDVKPLKAADVGITVKSQASGGVLDASKLTLLDGSFNLVTDVITQAREAYYSIRNSMRWALSCVVGKATLIFIAFLMQLFMSEILSAEAKNFAMPLTLLQIIWLTLLVNIIPLVALSKDTITNSIIYTRPRTSQNLFSSSYLDILVRGIVIALITLSSFLIVYKGANLLHTTEAAARTVACTVLVLTFLTYCFRCHRRPYETLIQRIFVNKSLLAAVLVSIALQLTAIYAPHFNQLLGMTPIGGKEWLFVAVFSLIGILLPLDITSRR
ncbi:cation-transporting P-type ATPase [Candidatus Poribacteria bacterium]|nr:cation-transporting P-type ATPase [Candidatus Poribacteria bacterium]